MIAHQAEAIILRTWPVHEADLLVSLFTRDQGKIKGMAKAAAKSRRRFGGALEPMTYVRATYVEKPRQELVRLDACEILASPLSDPVDYARACALAFYAEVLEEALPDHDPHDAAFRLLLSVLEQTRAAQIWLPLTYFSLWVTRLMGWLPDLTRCVVCEESLAGHPAYFHAQTDGLLCAVHRRTAGSILSPESQALTQTMLRAPLRAFSRQEWPRGRAADVRRFSMQALERHLERRLSTANALARLSTSVLKERPAQFAQTPVVE